MLASPLRPRAPIKINQMRKAAKSDRRKKILKAPPSHFSPAETNRAKQKRAARPTGPQ
jgi:hypothetical protein